MTALATAAFFAFGALLVLFGANGSEIVEALRIDDARLGLVGSMLSVGLGVGILVAGPLADRAPRRPLFVSACGVVFLAAWTLGGRTPFSALLLHAAFIGLGAGFYETLLNTVVVERSGPEASRHLMFIHAGATLGAATTPMAIGALRAPLELTWFDTFRVAGLLHLGIAAGAFGVLMQPSPAGGSVRPRAADAPGRDRDLFALASICLAGFAYVGVESALTLFVRRYAEIGLGLPAVRGGAAISAFWGGLLAGRLCAGLSPRMPGAGSIALLAAAAAGVVAAFATGWIRTPEIAMAAVGLALGGVFPILIALAGEAWPQRTGTAVGLAAGMGSLGGFLVPWLTGQIATVSRLSTAFVSLALWTALLAGACAIVRERRRRRRSA